MTSSKRSGTPTCQTRAHHPRLQPTQKKHLNRGLFITSHVFGAPLPRVRGVRALGIYPQSHLRFEPVGSGGRFREPIEMVEYSPTVRSYDWETTEYVVW